MAHERRAGEMAERAGEPPPRRGERNGRDRRPFTFLLDVELVERARGEVGERDMVRSIEAALAAAIDYQLWIREVAAGKRDALS